MENSGSAHFWTEEIARQHIAAARAGSTESLISLALNSDKIPLGNLNDVLNLFNPIFDAPDGFDPSAPLPDSLNARYEKVKLCLHGLAFLGFRVSNEPDFLRTLSSSWFKISKWAQFYFVDKCSTSSNSTQEEQANEGWYIRVTREDMVEIGAEHQCGCICAFTSRRNHAANALCA